MAFDGEGNFVRVHNWEQDRLNDICILSDRHDEEDDHFAEALNECMLRNGRVAFEGNLKMGSFQIKNLANGTVGTDAINKGQLDSSVSTAVSAVTAIFDTLVPIGDIKASVRTANHGKWLLCNGQAVSRTTYADLFALIGTNFGAGDGSTTFNVPDYRGKFLRGLGGNSAADLYTTQAEGLPQHTHFIANGDSTGGSTDITLTSSNYLQGKYLANGVLESYALNGTATTASIGKTSAASDAIYGVSSHVTPINQAVNWFIKAKKEA